MLRACVYLYSSTQCVVGTLDIVSKILKFPYKLFWIMISKEENQFARTLEKANWCQGELWVGQAQLHSGKSKAGAQSAWVGTLVPPVTTCLAGQITRFPGITVFLIWKMGLAVPTFQVVVQQTAHPPLLPKRGRTPFPGGKHLGPGT